MIDKDDVAVLQFSGGKDSIACLYLLRSLWDRITVLWANPGNPYPETVEYMNVIQEAVPRFIEVRGEQPAWVRAHGRPVDCLPIFSTEVGQSIAGKNGIRLQSTFDCCAHNLWGPCEKATRELGATVIIRGQKACDDLRCPVVDGQVVDGIRYLYPIVNWTDHMVFEYLAREGVFVPPQYSVGINTSLDCWDCTGYALHNQRRWSMMHDTHPEMWGSFRVTLDQVRAAVRESSSAYVQEH